MPQTNGSKQFFFHELSAAASHCEDQLSTGEPRGKGLRKETAATIGASMAALLMPQLKNLRKGCGLAMGQRITEGGADERCR